MDTHTRAVRRTLSVLLAVAALATAACSSSGSSSTAKAPVAYTADDGRFTAEFPSSPERDEQQVTVAGIDLVIVSYTTESKNDALTVGFTDYPEVTDVGAVLDAAADGSANQINGTIESKTDTTFLGVPAKDVVISTDGASVYERIFVVENRLYTLIGVAENARPTSYDHLLATFALL